MATNIASTGCTAKMPLQGKVVETTSIAAAEIVLFW